MPQLVELSCTACHKDAPPVSDVEKKHLLVQIPEWHISNESGIDTLIRRYEFSDFATALTFTDKVGKLAEQHAHHPTILTEWGSVEVRWWTHKIRNLHVNDFIMAAKTDLLHVSN